METMLLVILILSILHFAYESVIAPTLRVYQRNKLFILRDKIREIDFHALKGNDKYAYEYIEKGLNNTISNLSRLNLYSITKYIEKLEKDVNFKKEVENRAKKIIESSVSELKEIYEEAGQITFDTVCINSGAWFFYLVPIALVFYLFSKGLGMAKDLFVTPNFQTDEIVMDVC